MVASDDETLMGEIEANPKLWDMVQCMVKKVKTNESLAEATPSAAAGNGIQEQFTTPNRPHPEISNVAGRASAKSQSDATIYVRALNKKRIDQSANSPPVPTDNETLDKVANFIE